MATEIEPILDYVVNIGASELIVTEGAAPAVRLAGTFRSIGTAVNHGEAALIAAEHTCQRTAGDTGAHDQNVRIQAISPLLYRILIGSASFSVILPQTAHIWNTFFEESSDFQHILRNSCDHDQ